MPVWVFSIMMAPFIGSFLGTVIRRASAPAGLVFGRSRCDYCGAELAVCDLVPIASWFAQKGRCRRCDASLGLFYPSIEIAAVAVAVVVTIGDTGTPMRSLLDCVLGWVLLTLAWIDTEECRLPDWLTMPLVLSGLGVTAWEAPHALPDHALAAALGYLLFRAVGWVYRQWRGRDGLGQGDAKLVAAGGAWLGLGSLSWLVLVAAVTALIGVAAARLCGYRFNRASAIPFGPFIALAFFFLRLHSVIEL